MINLAWLTPPGEVVDVPGGLETAKGRAFAELLRSAQFPYFQLVECRRWHEADVIVFEVHPQVPQVAPVDIRHVERMSVVFSDADDRTPAVLSMRPDFPSIPHVQVPEDDWAWPFLCLYDMPYDELRPRWTSARFARRVHEWLSQVARGELYQEDERLEPFIAARAPEIVVPHRMFSDTALADARLYASAVDDGTPIYFLSYENGAEGRSGLAFKVFTITLPPQLHGPLRRQPRTLAGLQDLVAPLGVDLRSELRKQVTTWHHEGFGAEHLLILIAAPLQRGEGCEPEKMDLLIFLAEPTIDELGVKLGLFAFDQGRYVHLLLATDRPGDDVPVELCRPVSTLSREFAAALNGVEPDARTIVGVGVGALGSQVTRNLVQSGFGTWTLVDHDTFLPHNTVRHALPRAAVGFNKAGAMAVILNDLFDGMSVAHAIRANILRGSNDVSSSIISSELVLDTSASVQVARALAIDIAGGGRRISAFLNPEGTALIILAEDLERRVRLDDLEMQYYREILRNDVLLHHLRPAGRRLQYGRSCRDVSSNIPQAMVAIHAGIASRAIRAFADHAGAHVQIWTVTTDNEIRSLRPTISPVVEFSTGGWKIRVDEWLLALLEQTRSSKLPKETGGVLIGYHDLHRKILYVVDALPAPVDSQEWPVAFIRGSEGLKDVLDEVASRTGDMIAYVGEWHSHPGGFAALPSADDLNVARWIAAEMAKEELPGLMAIVGDHGPRWYIAQVRDGLPIQIALEEAAPAGTSSNPDERSAEAN